LTLEQFGELTPLQFKALRERRHAEFRRSCYVAGITASLYANAHRKENTPPLSPFDFVPGRTPQSERDKLKHNVLSLFVSVEGASAESIADLRKRTIEKLKAQGYEDAEVILEEIFPSKR
jgi:hypothetical protein